MADQLRHVRRAADFLSAGGTDFDQRFFNAVNEFWAAMFDPDDWPTDLLEKANSVVDRILAGGTVHQRLFGVDEATAKQVAGDIISLADAIDEARAKGVVPSEGGKKGSGE